MKNFLTKYFLCVSLFLIANQVLGQSSFIESINPKAGYSGELVDIKGVGLGDADRVFFGSVEGNLISVSDQLIEAEVPSGATYDNVSVFNSTTRLYYSGEHFLLSYGGEQGITSSNFDGQLDFSSGSGSQRGLYDVSIVDLDGDGKNDIVGTNSRSNIARILRNQSTPGNLNLVPTEANLGVDFSGLNSTFGDLNGDGKPEVIFSQNNGSDLTILVNFSTPGNLSFTRKTVSLEGALTKRVVVKDLDLDGKPDLVVSDQSNDNNRVLIVKNTSSGGSLSFSTDIIELTVNNATSTAGLDVEDINGDGQPDIITSQSFTSNGGFFIASNQSSPGNFSFDDFKQFNTSGIFVNLKVADLNNDKKPDVVATLLQSRSVAVFLNETSSIGGEPAFGTAQNIGTDDEPWGLDFGDMDGDGNIDIIVSTTGDDKAVNVLNNNGSGGIDFSSISIPVTFINRNVKVGDIDGDSKPDIVFTSIDDQNNNIPASQISILRNNKCITPVITPEGPINVCLGNPVLLKAQDIDGLTYEWKQDGTIVKSSTDNFIELNDAAASGSYTVTILSEGGVCAESSAAVEVTIVSSSTLPNASLTSTAPVCSGETLTLTSSDVGATTYEWRGPENFTATGLTVEVENFNIDKAGRYYLDVYAGSCIVETKSIIVDVISSPRFSIEQSGAGAYCEGEVVSLSVTPNSSDFSFQWYEGTSPISGATNASYEPTNSGSYYAEITDQINTSCPSIYSDTLEVAFLALPVVDFSSPSRVCIGSTVSFTNESVVADESIAQYNWDLGDGSSSTSQNPSHTYSSAGTYQVTLEVSYEGFSSCNAEFTQQIVINEAPNVAISSSASSICEGDSVVLSLSDAFETYQWDTGETSPTITINQGGSYSVTVLDQNGCEGFSEISVQQFPSPNVALSASSTTVSSGETVTITASGLLDYVWFADSVELEFTEDQIDFAPTSTTTIRAEGQDENGCFGIGQVTISVDEGSNIGDRLTPMRFFSPNNDAIAQFWEIENIDDFSQCGVEIYDQQGNKIYEAKPYNNDWEGTANGSPVPDGVYYYVIRCDGSGIAKSGSITLLR